MKQQFWREARVKPVDLIQQTQDEIERRIAKGNDQLGIKESRFLVKSITWSLIGSTIFGLTWLTIAQTEEIIVAPGKLEPIGDVKTIQVPLGGVLADLRVKEGQRVSKGQILLRLDNEASKDKEKTLVKAIEYKRKQIDLKKQEINQYLHLNTTEQIVLGQNLSYENDILQRLIELKRAGAAAEFQYLQQRNKAAEIKGQLAKAKVDRFRQLAVLKQSLEQLYSEETDLESKLKETRINIRYQDIRSPVDGVVFDLKPANLGFVAQGSEPVMKIVPYNRLKAQVEIPSDKIGFVTTGKPVDLNIDSFPSSDFGVLKGVVKTIGSDAVPPDQNNPTYRFPAEIQLNSQSLILKNKLSLPLQVGMSVQANIKLRKVSYLQLFMGEFRSKADSLRRI